MLTPLLLVVSKDAEENSQVLQSFFSCYRDAAYVLLSCKAGLPFAPTDNRNLGSTEQLHTWLQ